MSDGWKCLFAGLGLATVAVALAWFIGSFPDSAPLPISGRIVEKIEAFTGHNNTVYILKIERASERYIYIVVTAQVWHSVLTGVQYNFETGGKSGYDSAVETTRE